MNSLKVLDLSQNTVRNLEPLCTSPNLQELYLQNNAITGLEAISGLKNLGKLDAYGYRKVLYCNENTIVANGGKTIREYSDGYPIPIQKF